MNLVEDKATISGCRVGKLISLRKIRELGLKHHRDIETNRAGVVVEVHADCRPFLHFFERIIPRHTPISPEEEQLKYLLGISSSKYVWGREGEALSA
jgi:hypothetical protein